MMGQYDPTADETFPFINCTFTQSLTPRKAHSNVVWLVGIPAGALQPSRSGGGLDYAPNFAETPGSFGACDREAFCISAAIT